MLHFFINFNPTVWQLKRQADAIDGKVITFDPFANIVQKSHHLPCVAEQNHGGAPGFSVAADDWFEVIVLFLIDLTILTMPQQAAITTSRLTQCH